MEYPGGGGNNREQHPSRQQSKSYISHQQHQEARQPQHRGVYAQQQQPQAPLYSQALKQQQPGTTAHPGMYGQSVAYGQMPTHPQDVNMANASSQVLEREYLQQQHLAQQQYLQQQQQQHTVPYGTPGYLPNQAATGQYVAAHQQQIPFPHQYAMQQQQHQGAYTGVGGATFPMVDASSAAQSQHLPPPHPNHPISHPSGHIHQQTFPPAQSSRRPSDRPLIKLSVSLIDTYKHINTIYYEQRENRRAARAKEKSKKESNASGEGGPPGTGATNNGWDDENYDYIVTPGELFYGRYRMKERIGKGSFGQVVRAEDTKENKDVAIKIIKSKKPFLMQAKTEIELLTHLKEKDPEDQYNIVTMTTHFMHRNHQCLVFEMLSLNLYELLKNTQFGGVSLNLIRKFAKQVLKSLSFLARSDVDVIHCDLKPENILLRHPKKSGIKVIDFGSSCRSNKRMYSYIQSRFYRSPEVMLGLPYAVSIDMWSLGCILAEMHTGEPLFSGSDQFDQMQKIVKLLGMVPSKMLDKANDQHRLQFFEKAMNPSNGLQEWCIRQVKQRSSSRGAGSTSSSPTHPNTQENVVAVVPSSDPIASLSEVIQAETHRKKKYPPTETGNSERNYQHFVDLIHRMLSYDPKQRIKPEDALAHPFITEQIK